MKDSLYFMITEFWEKKLKISLEESSRLIRLKIMEDVSWLLIETTACPKILKFWDTMKSFGNPSLPLFAFTCVI